MLKLSKVKCPYCGKKANLVDSSEIYNGRSYGLVWLCRPCRAYVGVHEGTEKPLGRLANKELREWKVKAHSAFDRLWKTKIIRDGCSKTKARKAGCRWLAGELGVSVKQCHIGMFDVNDCKRVVEICQNIGRNKE